MGKIVIRTDGDKIRVRLREEAKAPEVRQATGARTLEPTEIIKQNREMLLLPVRLINLMENRVESGFRPNEEDVEIVYALSGINPNMPDMLHKLSSSDVIEANNPDYVITSVRAMMEYIVQERGNEPKLVIQIHTHPQGISMPSQRDKTYFANAAQSIKALAPGCHVIFGVHVLSSESIRERLEPTKLSINTLRWSSIRREHEVGFYEPNGKIYEVELYG